MTYTALQNFPLIQRGDSVGDLIASRFAENQKDVLAGDCIVVAQKIISKAEGRRIFLDEIEPGKRAKELAVLTEKDPRLIEVILSESSEVLRARPGLIIVEHRLGFVCANAGIDHSNVAPAGGRESVLLLPKRPDRSAQEIRTLLEQIYGVEVGVLIIDSHGRAWRMGTVGIAIGVAGIPALTDLRGTPDLYGNDLEVTQVGTADELAAAASLIMGQAAEKTPVVQVRGFPYSLRKSQLDEVLRPIEDDLFR